MPRWADSLADTDSTDLAYAAYKIADILWLGRDNYSEYGDECLSTAGAVIRNARRFLSYWGKAEPVSSPDLLWEALIMISFAHLSRDAGAKSYHLRSAESALRTYYHRRNR